MTRIRKYTPVKIKSPLSQKLDALQKLEYYLLEQRKLSVDVYTNDAVMKELLEKAHPNLRVELWNMPPSCYGSFNEEYTMDSNCPRCRVFDKCKQYTEEKNK